MAPKRKKESTENETPAPAKAIRAKRQRTTAIPEDSIETPPPTPKPAATTRKRKAAPKAETITEDGEPSEEAGAAHIEVQVTSAPEIQPTTNEPAVIPTPQPKLAAASKKRKVVIDAEEEEDIMNGEEAAKALATAAKKQKTLAPTDNFTIESQPHPLASTSTSAPITEKSPTEASTPQHTQALTEYPPPTAIPLKQPSITPSNPTLRETSAMAEQARKSGKMKGKHDRLYDACVRAKPIGDNFDAEELRKLGIAEDDQDLLDMTQELIRRFLFIAMSLNKGLIYKTRSKAVAIKLAQLTADSLLVYTIIEGAGVNGIWRRPLESRTNLHQSNVSRALKDLHAEKLVKEYKAFKSTRRTWVTSDITPSADALGGSFVVDNGKFDVGLVDAVTTAVVSYIEEQSWAERPPAPEQNRHKSVSRGHHKHKSKTPAAPPVSEEVPQIEDPIRKVVPIFRTSMKNGNVMVPRHPSFTKYPTVLDVMFELNHQKVSKITLNQDDTQQILNKMEFDGFIERMRDDQGRVGDGYRSVRRVWQQERFGSSTKDFGPLEPNEYSGVLPGNGVSQVPCVRCPVRELCKPGGVVSPEKCEYLGDWMAF